MNTRNYFVDNRVSRITGNICLTKQRDNKYNKSIRTVTFFFHFYFFFVFQITDSPKRMSSICVYFHDNIVREQKKERIENE